MTRLPRGPQLATRANPAGLTGRQAEILRLLADGLSNADIAARLHLSDGTVRNYLSEAIGKLGANNRIDAYRLARQRGWL